MKSDLLANSCGQSMIQVLISVAIMGIAMLAFASMMATQQREMAALNQKLAAMDLEKLLVASLADGSVCEYVTNHPASLTFDATQVSSAPQIISLPASMPLYASVKTSPSLAFGPVVAEVGQPVSTTEIQSIKLSVSGAPSPLPPAGATAIFTGNWVIELNPDKLIRGLRPITVATTLAVDMTTPSAAKIAGCQLSALGVGAPDCRVVIDEGPFPHYHSYATCDSDEYLLNGGGKCAAMGTDFSATGFERGTLTDDHVQGSDSWSADCYDWTVMADVASRAWATCCKK